MVFALNGWQNIKDLDKHYSYGVDSPLKTKELFKFLNNTKNTEIVFDLLFCARILN